MATLKQPQLGQTILALRQEKNITQEELVDRCNVSVRTIQRIEAGEVTPRDSTLRIILASLDYDFDKAFHKVQFKQRIEILNMAWILGSIYFLAGIAETLLDYYRFEPNLPVYFSWVYTCSKMIILTTYIVFMYGFVEVGTHFKSSLLKISAFLMIGSMSIMEIYDIITLFSNFTDEEFLFVKGLEGVAFAGIDIAFGIALFKLSKDLGDVGKITGLLQIGAGLCFLTFILGFIGLFILLPATILEIIILYKMYDRLKTE
ncbi:helix-turn-helix domain-containing protein [Reichenbachiella sp.]|uniref:helix-turn-helix domain-containing protein n=1 Tax=Reichenbachiella sp. TaxID=2184521 RepID=UPI003B5AD98A